VPQTSILRSGNPQSSNPAAPCRILTP
jgi:hypothetical protein